MPIPQFLALILLTVGSLGAAVYWSVVLGHVLATRRNLPTARDGLELADAQALLNSAPRVCVVIPAHNEEGVIGELAGTLRTQDYPALSVVFALDRCTDRTGDVLREAIGGDPRFHVHEIASCPPEWAGKVHAIHSAVREAPAAKGAELLLFADADTLFDPACVRACVGLLQNRGLDLLSLLSTLTTVAWFERVVQPAAAMELLRQYPPRKVGKGAESRPFANGQFMLFRREAYDAVGGHEAAKEHLLEDIHLARLVAWSERTVGVFMADGMLRCRMYPTWAAFRRGWKRIYIEAANCRPGRLSQTAYRVGVVGVVLPAAAAVSAAAGGLVYGLTRDPLGFIACSAGVLGCSAFVAALSQAFRLGRTPLSSVPFYPLGALLVSGLLAEAAADLTGGKATQWGGRAYQRPVR